MARTGYHQLPNINWRVTDYPLDQCIATSVEHSILAVLMDIREELRGLNATLDCGNFQEIPRVLRAVRANTTRIANRVAPRKPRGKK